MKLDELVEKRRLWYLDNEYAELSQHIADCGENMHPFIRLKLDTELRRDQEVIEWVLENMK